MDLRKAAMVSSVAVSPAMARAGSPGTLRSSMNVKIEAPKTVASATPRRLRSALVIGSSLRLEEFASGIQDFTGPVRDNCGEGDCYQQPQARESGDPPLPGQEELLAFGDHFAPFCGGRLGPQPEVPESCQGQHGSSEHGSHLQDHDGYQVGQNMPEQHPGRVGADRHWGANEV